MPGTEKKRNRKKAFTPLENVFFLTGFTLIDILVAITIFAIIASGIATVITSGLKIWDRARTTDFSRAVSSLSLETIAQELRQGIFIFNIIQSAWEGTPEEFYFTAISRDSILRVGYRFDAANKMLVRKVKALKDAIGNAESPYAEKEILAADEISFSFFGKEKDSYAWLDVWPKKNNSAFIAVRIKVRIKGEEFTRTIFIPVSH